MKEVSDQEPASPENVPEQGSAAPELAAEPTTEPVLERAADWLIQHEDAPLDPTKEPPKVAPPLLFELPIMPDLQAMVQLEQPKQPEEVPETFFEQRNERLREPVDQTSAQPATQAALQPMVPISQVLASYRAPAPRGPISLSTPLVSTTGPLVAIRQLLSTPTYKQAVLRGFLGATILLVGLGLYYFL